MSLLSHLPFDVLVNDGPPDRPWQPVAFCATRGEAEAKRLLNQRLDPTHRYRVEHRYLARARSKRLG